MAWRPVIVLANSEFELVLGPGISVFRLAL